MNIETVWQQYSSVLKAFLLSKISSPDEAEDLLQEILIKTHQNIHTLQDQQSIKPWLFQIANRTIIDYYRKQAAASNNVQAEDLWYGDLESSESNQVQAELSQCIEPFIAALPDTSASLLDAIDLKGVSQKELAKELDVSYSTLKSRVQKARKELKDLFDDCCHLELDKSGTPIDYIPKKPLQYQPNCKKC